MNIKKLIIAGFVVDLISIVLPMITYSLFKWIFFLEPSGIWKWTPDTPLSSISIYQLIFIFLLNTVLAFYFALLYFVIQKSIQGTKVTKGIRYGLLIYPVGVLIPMFSMYVLLNISAIAVLFFILEGLLEYLLYGLSISFIAESQL